MAVSYFYLFLETEAHVRHFKDQIAQSNPAFLNYGSGN